MPYGTSWTRFCMAGLTAYLFMLAGAQTVHMIYRPLEDLDSRVQQEIQKLKLNKSGSQATTTTTTSESSST